MYHVSAQGVDKRALLLLSLLLLLLLWLMITVPVLPER